MIISLSATAQIKKGAILLGGQISYADANANYSATQPDLKSRSANFNVSVGKAFKENKILGVSVSYGHFNSDYNYNGNTYTNIISNRYNFDFFYRQYMKLAKDFYFFGELGAGYVGGNETDTDIPGNSKTKYTESGAELYLTPGIAYRIYKKLQVELLIPQIAGVNYIVQKRTLSANNPSDYRQDQLRINTNLNSSLLSNLGLGFRFVL